MHDPTRSMPCALDVRILRFLYEYGASSVDDFHERSGFADDGHDPFATLEGFKEAARKSLIEIEKEGTGLPDSTVRYKASVDARTLRSLLVRNAVNASIGAQTEEFRQLMAELAKLPRE